MSITKVRKQSGAWERHLANKATTRDYNQTMNAIAKGVSKGLKPSRPTFFDGKRSRALVAFLKEKRGRFHKTRGR